MVDNLTTVLMKHNDISEAETIALVDDFKKDLNERVANGEMPHDICEEWFGPEPDYNGFSIT